MAVENKTRKNVVKRPPPAPKPFTSEQQPSPEAKSEGWKKLRAQRLLTQAILKHMTEGQNLDTYIKSLYKNAVKGNAKAIETINKGVEDDIIKIESNAMFTVTMQPASGCEPINDAS